MRLNQLILSLTAAAIMVGCATSSTNPVSPRDPARPAGTSSGIVEDAAIRQGDSLTIRITGITPEINQIEEVNEFGMISLPYINTVKAEGLTPGVLQKKIERAYLDGGYYTKLSVSVTPGQRVLYINGEVRMPGKVVWSSGLTVAKAISLAGGFTEYANRSEIEVHRRDTILKVNFKEAERDPSQDVEVFPRDNIKVSRSLF
jgi:protein involved in polysaccharide export with SLBB domain